MRVNLRETNVTMKPKIIKSILLLVRKLFAVNLAKDKQGVQSFGTKGQIPSNGPHEACALNPAWRPGEKEMAALVAYDLGDPSCLNELVQEGYVFGTLKGIGRIWHDVKLRDLGTSGKRESVANDAAAREDAMANAADAPIDGSEDGWIKIAPYGVYPGSRPGRLQHFTESEANAMMAEFGSLRGKAGRLFRGIPIFIGHPDVNPQIYTDHRRLGKITNLEPRADGLYGEVEWNSLGLENKAQGYWVFPSPRWDCPLGQPEFRPDRLLSVGLTNTPRIVGSEPVTNSLDFPDPNTNQTDNNMDRKILTEKLGLEITATDEEILAKIASLMSAEATAASKAQEAVTMTQERDTVANSLTTATARITALETELKTTREAVANSKLDAAVNQGKITLAERAAWLPKLVGENREAEANALDAITPKLNTTPLDVTNSRVQIGNAAERREAIANAVDANMAKGMDYDTAYAAAEKDPALKPVWDAMNRVEE
jgi:Mu-like prophage I protein